MQFASSTALTLASIAVGLIALNVGYRNNFGWKPILLVKSYGIGSGHDWTEVHCIFEVWNRRKYPLVVREMQVSFGDLKVDREARGAAAEGELWWATKEGTLITHKSVSIEPTRHQEFEAVGPVRSDAGAVTDVVVWVDLFDPRKNGHVVLRARANFGRSRWWLRRRRLPSYSSSNPVKRQSQKSMSG